MAGLATGALGGGDVVPGGVRHSMNNAAPAMGFAACVLLAAGCGTGTPAVFREAAESDKAPPQVGVVLPPIAVQDGDGLPETLPDDLVWLTNAADPVYASPEARRGGTLRTSIASFPLTLRRVGPDSNGSFAGYLRPNQFGPIALHPQTRRAIPALATHWAFGADGRSIYYKLNPEARWSDGVPVTADDFVYAVQFMRSKEIVAPWYTTYYTERIRDVKRYDDLTYGVQGASPMPGAEMHATYGIGPQPRHFHVLTKTWPADFNWRIEPNTGPYEISQVRKGKYIVMTRKGDWWGNDLRYFKHRFNPDRIHVKVIRDSNVAFQHFLKGELDTFGLTLPFYWHDKARGEEFDNGYIVKYWFYSEIPAAAGMYLNSLDPLLADERIRFGLAHSMNFDRVIETVLRGDYERLPTFQIGFGEYDNHDIKPRAFDLDSADAHFDAAGFDTRGGDGIRVRPDGQRLSFKVTYGWPDHTQRLVVLQEEAKKAGVELQLDLLDSAGAFKKMREKKHQIAWSAWAAGGLAPGYWEHFHSVNAGKAQTNNLTNHSNPEMDPLIMAYRTAASLGERVALARRLEQMVHDSGVVIPTFRTPYTRAGAWRWVKLPAWLGTRTAASLFSPFADTGGFSGGGLFWIDIDEKRRTRDARDDGVAYEPLTVVNTDYRMRSEG